ncbi:MAG: EAL domain-containing protein, partial [Methylococcaceae bacterium]
MKKDKKMITSNHFLPTTEESSSFANKHVIKYWLIALLLFSCILMAELAYQCQVLSLASSFYRDNWTQQAATRQAKHVSIVYIDEKTSAQYPHQPLAFWTPQIAQTLTTLRLAGARITGLDMLLLFNPSDWIRENYGEKVNEARVYNQHLLEELNTGKVILPAYMSIDEQGETVYVLPHQEYALSLPEQDLVTYIGIARFTPDADGIIRYWTPIVDPMERNIGSMPRWNFASLIAMHAMGMSPYSEARPLGGMTIPVNNRQHAIGYLGPPNTIPSLSMSELLEPNALKNPKVQALKDRVVIIGTRGSISDDYVQTPYARGFLDQQGELMPGAELVANVVETILTGIYPKELAMLPRVTFLLIGVSLAVLVAFGISSTLVSGGILFLLLFAIYLLGKESYQYGFLLPVAELQMVSIISFLTIQAYALYHSKKMRVQLKETIENLTRNYSDWQDTIIKESPAIIFLADMEHYIYSVSDLAVEVLRLPRDKLIGQQVFDFVHIKDRVQLKNWIGENAVNNLNEIDINDESNRATNNSLKNAIGKIKSDEEWLDSIVNLLPYKKGIEKDTMNLWTFQDISQMKELRALIDWHENYDVLTQLPKRCYFLELCNSSLYKQSRVKKEVNSTNEPLSIMISVGLDAFDIFLDTTNTSTGDKVLQIIAQTLINFTESDELVARVGEYSFALLLDGKYDRQTLEKNLASLLYSLQVPKEIKQQHYVSFSIGISYCISDKNAERDLHNAELAMHRINQNNHVHINYYADDMEAQINNRKWVVDQMHFALENQGILVYYQPIVDIKTSTLRGAEALVRMQNESGELIPPIKFIPTAEQTGLINEIGFEVLKQAITCLGKWRHQHNWQGYISVNLSTVQLLDKNLADKIGLLLKENNVQGSSLLLELTESLFINEDIAVLKLMDKLLALGCRFAIDDFGTGYSSMSYLHRINASVIKVDRSFIKDLPDNEKQAKIVLGIQNIASTLDLGLICEGVSEDVHLQWLIKNGFSLGQGFLFSKPLPE